MAAMQGRRSLKRIETACRNHQTRQSIGYFRIKAHWDAPRVLAETALETLKTLGWKTGDPVDWVLDDTQKIKRGKQMDILSTNFLHAANAELVRANGIEQVVEELEPMGVGSND